MKNRSAWWLGLVLAGFTFLGGGCVKGVREGFNGGLNDAVSATVETLFNSVLASILPAE